MNKITFLLFFSCFGILFSYYFILFYHRTPVWMVILIIVTVLGTFLVSCKVSKYKGLFLMLLLIGTLRLLFYGWLPIYSFYPNKYTVENDVDHFILTIPESTRRNPLRQAIPNHQLIFGLDTSINITKYLLEETDANLTGGDDLDMDRVTHVYTLINYSYQKAFKEAYYKSNKTWIVMLEDDAYPVFDYFNKLEKVINLKNQDIIWLYTTQVAYYTFFGKYTHGFVGMVYRRNLLLQLANELHINSQPIRTFYQKNNPLTTYLWTGDKYMAFQCTRKKYKCSSYPLIRERITQSTIDPHLDGYLRNKTWETASQSGTEGLKTQ